MALIGCKAGMWPHIRAYLPRETPTHTLVPFAGTTAAAAALQEEGHNVTVMTDLNRHFVRVFRHMRDDPEFTNRVDVYMNIIRSAGDTQEQCKRYRALRSEYNSEPTFDMKSAEQAALAYTLWRLTFNGVVKVNQKGHFVPVAGISPAKMKLYDYRRSYDEYQPHLQKLPPIEYEDYRMTFQRAERGDFVYVDPPYDGVFNEYIGTHPFCTETLIEELNKLTERGVLWMLSNSASRDWLQHFDCMYTVHRRRGGYGGTEVVVTNYSDFM